MIPEKLADQWEDIFPTPPAEHYRLCIQGEASHADLDREQALLLSRTLFREADTGKMAPLDFAVADWDWTRGRNAPSDGVLDTTGTPLVKNSSRIVPEQTLSPLPGRLIAARVPACRPHNTYYYSWGPGHRRYIGGGGNHPLLDAGPHCGGRFSWDNLNACLEALSVA